MAFVEFVHYEASCDNSCVDRNIFFKTHGRTSSFKNTDKYITDWNRQNSFMWKSDYQHITEVVRARTEATGL